MCRLRVTLLIFTGDHPAQCKVANLKDGGWSSCRRCHVRQRSNSSSKLVFQDEFLGTKLKKAPAKTMEELIQGLDRWEAAETKTHRDEISNETGVYLEILLVTIFQMLYKDVMNVIN